MRLAALVTPLACLAGVADTYFANLVRAAAGGHSPGGTLWLFGGAITGAAVFLCWCACYLGIQIHEEMQVEHRSALRAEANAREAQWMALRAQLNPHFLFNSLNSVQALIEEDPARAQDAIGRLASLLRYSLNQEVARMVPLAEEIEMIDRYLAIEKMRFEENLRVSIEIQPEAMDRPIPGFLLHPLVENAIRYGMQTSTMPLEVRLRASCGQGGLNLEVANTGYWADGDGSEELRPAMEQGIGLGLELVRKQLEQNFSGGYRFERAVAGGWIVQRIRIEGAPYGLLQGHSQVETGAEYALSRSAG